MLQFLLYNLLIIPFFKLVSIIMQLISPKYRERERLSKAQIKQIKLISKDYSTKVWFHASSMGEFEQAKPIIEILKRELPDVRIIVSFYSPSGYLHQKNYTYADEVFYLPFDSLWKAKLFIDKLNPSIVVFVRYDLWYNFVYISNKRNITLLLICATKPTNTNSFLDKYYFSKIYNFLALIHTVGYSHTNYFKSLNLKCEIIEGHDTRYDRIINTVESQSQDFLHLIKNSDDFIIIAGSTWEEDENLLHEFYPYIETKPNLKLVIVPHEPTPENITRLKSQFVHSKILSLIGPEHISFPKVLIIDRIGILLQLYSFADAVYVGGGFGKGVHSVAEPAGYGLPIAVGPKYRNSPDAIKLKQLDLLQIVQNPIELKDWLVRLMSDIEFYKELSAKTKAYIYSGKGESEKIARIIENLLIRKNC